MKNREFKEGDQVNYHSIIGGEITSRNHTITCIDEMCGTKVAWITDMPACVDLEALSHVDGGDGDE